jgi:hypothetical protein
MMTTIENVLEVVEVQEPSTKTEALLHCNRAFTPSLTLRFQARTKFNIGLQPIQCCLAKERLSTCSSCFANMS